MLTETVTPAPSRQEVRVDLVLTAVEAKMLADIADDIAVDYSRWPMDMTKRRLFEKLERAVRNAEPVIS